MYNIGINYNLSSQKELMTTQYLQETNHAVFSDEDLEITLDKIVHEGNTIAVQFSHSDGYYVDTLEIVTLELYTWLWLKTLGYK